MNRSQFCFAVYCISAYLGSGCAFRESHKGIGVNPSSPPTLPSQPDTPIPLTPTTLILPATPERTGYLSINGTKADGTSFGEYKREFKMIERSPVMITTPIVLPQEIPHEFKLSVSATGLNEKPISRITASGRMSLEGGVVSELTVTELEALPTQAHSPQAWSTKLSGLEKLLSNSEESIAYLQVNLFSEGSTDPDQVITLPLMTPPSKVSTEQLSTVEFEGKYGSVVSPYKTYLGTGFRLDLLQVIRIKNSSSRPVSTHLPLKLNGTLSSHFTKVDLNQQTCTFSTSSSGWDEQLATDLYLLPLGEEVSNDFMGFINKQLKTGAWEMGLQAGEEKLIGIYAQGPRVPEVTTGTYARPTLQGTQVVTACKSRCPNPNFAFFSGYWSKVGWPGASHACVQSENCPLAIGVWTPRINEALCNQCMEWDLRENHAWKDAHSPMDADYPKTLCRGNEAGRYGWVVEKTPGSVSTGIQSDSVLLNLSAESTLLKIRFDISVEKEISQERIIPGLIRQASIQLR